jgi:hypothetical protein
MFDSRFLRVMAWRLCRRQTSEDLLSADACQVSVTRSLTLVQHPGLLAYSLSTFSHSLARAYGRRRTEPGERKRTDENRNGGGFIEPVTLMGTRKRNGRPRHLDAAAGCLGIVLMWCCTRGAVSRSLCMMFGLTLLTPMQRWLELLGKTTLLHMLASTSSRHQDQEANRC